MKKGISLLICFLIFQKGFCQELHLIHLKTVMDSVAYWHYKERKCFTELYQFVDIKDSAFLKLICNCQTEGMSSEPRCHKYFEFVPAIADGVYKIMVDDKAVLLSSFVGGKKNGYECTFARRQHGRALKRDEKHLFFQHYADGILTEYYKLNTKGMVVEYCPVVVDSLGKRHQDLFYYFDNKGGLSSICYALWGYATDYFSKTGRYKYTELPYEDKRYNGKPSKRYYYQLKKIERVGMEKGEIPNGLVALKRQDMKYSLEFENAAVLNWQYSHKSSGEHWRFDIPSTRIGRYRKDLMALYRN